MVRFWLAQKSSWKNKFHGLRQGWWSSWTSALTLASTSFSSLLSWRRTLLRGLDLSVKRFLAWSSIHTWGSGNLTASQVSTGTWPISTAPTFLSPFRTSSWEVLSWFVVEPMRITYSHRQLPLQERIQQSVECDSSTHLLNTVGEELGRQKAFSTRKLQPFRA